MLDSCLYIVDAIYLLLYPLIAEGTPEQHDALIRRVSVGRSTEQVAMLARAREVFEGEESLEYEPFLLFVSLEL